MSRFEIICGDCLELIKTIETGSIGAVICDPPYGTTNCEWDVPLNWTALWSEIWRVCASPSAPVVLFSAQPFTTDLICSQRKFFRYELIWEKTMPTGFLDANRRPLRNHENILVFSQSGHGNYIPQMQTGFAPYRASVSRGANVYGNFDGTKGRSSDGDRHPASVWKAGNRASEEHSTQKPIPLMERLVLSYSSEGDTVLDFTCGSGSTGVACLRHNRQFIGFEQREDYAVLSRQRLEATTGQFSPREFGGLFAEAN